MKFDLKFSELVQGSFSPGELNLMMVMQVNCPGCFLYGIPEMINLFHHYKESVSFFALSTAFEDFELNTLENTKRLVEDGYVVGETKKAFLQRGHDRNPFAIPFTVMVDAMIEKEELHHPKFAEHVVGGRAELVLAHEKDEWANSLTNYFNNFEKCGYTFAANLLQGTPTFILFDRHKEILSAWFGHVRERAIAEKLNHALSTTTK